MKKQCLYKLYVYWKYAINLYDIKCEVKNIYLGALLIISPQTYNHHTIICFGVDSDLLDSILNQKFCLQKDLFTSLSVHKHIAQTRKYSVDIYMYIYIYIYISHDLRVAKHSLISSNIINLIKNKFYQYFIVYNLVRFSLIYLKLLNLK